MQPGSAKTIIVYRSPRPNVTGHKCHPPRWLERWQNGIQVGDRVECTLCPQVWEWREWAGMDTTHRSWERVNARRPKEA